MTTGQTGAAQDGYFLMWNNSDGYWEPDPGFVAAGDLTPNSPFYGRTNQIVSRIQQRSVSSAAPSDGYAFIWEAVDNEWEPQALAVVWHNSLVAGDGYITRTNIRSNRLLQSPSQNATGLVGMTNFGSSTLNMGGASASYVSILGGDNNTAAAAFAAILGGSLNTASDGYALVLDGYNNSAGGRFSTVLNGTLNTITVNGIESFILDGYSNSISSFNSFILNGGNNSVSSSYAGILSGQGNSIANGNNYAWIGFGNSNTITGSAATYAMILGGGGNTTNSQNVFIGNPTSANVQSSYGAVLTGASGTIGTSSNYATIINGNVVTINNNSLSALVGNGSTIGVTGNYATVLNGNNITVNGNNSTVLNGVSNSVTGSFSAIANGSSNTISGGISWAYILDGYSNSVTNSGGFIADGYNNTVNGPWASIVNGNHNTINARNSTILNGSFNTMDSASSENTILVGNNNTHTSSNNTVTIGSGNTFTNASSHFILGSSNNTQSAFSFTNGSNNTHASGASFNRTWGSFNTIGTGSTINAIFGNSNSLAPTTTTTGNFIAGSSNVIDGFGNSLVSGSNNTTSASFSLIQGQWGKSRLFGQYVQANSHFNPTGVGEAQFSRVVLTGAAGSGTAFTLQLQDTVPTNMTFTDGSSYEMNIRVLVISNSPTSPFPVVTARYGFDVLAHQESGVLIIDNVNQSMFTQNGSTWTVSVSGYSQGSPAVPAPTNNQFVIQVDTEATPYIQGTPSSRRAIATVDIREITRL